MKQNLMKLIYKQRKVLAIALALLLVVSACGFAWTCKEQVIINDNGKTVEVNAYNYGGNIRSAMKGAGIVLGKNDEYRVTSTSWFSGQHVEIYRAVPVTVTFQGKTETIMTGKPTVGEIAAVYCKNGEYKTSVDASLRPTVGMQVVIKAIQEKTVDVIRPVKFETVSVPDDRMEKGQTELVQTGKEGSEKAVVKQIYEDGVLVSEQTVSATQITAPVASKVRVGTRDTVETSRGSERFRAVKYMTATAYTEADGPGGGYTAIGLRAKHGVVAVDPNVIPLGTRLYIEGYGMAIAGDTGGAINGNIIDLCMDHNSEAINFGRQTVKVYILQ